MKRILLWVMMGMMALSLSACGNLTEAFELLGKQAVTGTLEPVEEELWIADAYDGEMGAASSPLAMAAPGSGGRYRQDSIDWQPLLQSGETYLEIDENKEKLVASDPLTTFSLKVDTAAYTNVQRYLNGGQVPPADAVRIEEMVNYFSYDQPLAFTGDSPFAIYTEIGPSPIREGRYLAFTRVATRSVDKADLPPLNLTFLIDTSGSMDSYDKLPLLKEALTLLTETLEPRDRVSIVTYAGSSAVLLDGAGGDRTADILDAIGRLEPWGSTAGADGIRTAYMLAEKNFMPEGNNRIILASDGDFNVGISSVEELERLIAGKRESGIYLSVLGFGTGNIRDDIMETLSKHGNGNYSYINSVATARKVLVEEMAASLFVVAEDVKAQIEFNPENVKSYRLIGYENRMLANEDFEDDTKDAGEIGMGTDVLLLYELELWQDATSIDLKYQETQTPPPRNDDAPYADELFEVRIRYKDPGQSQSKLLLIPATFDRLTEQNSDDFYFAGAVAAFGHMLRDSPYTERLRTDDLIQLASLHLGTDAKGYRSGFVDLIRAYRIATRDGLLYR